MKLITGNAHLGQQKDYGTNRQTRLQLAAVRQGYFLTAAS